MSFRVQATEKQMRFWRYHVLLYLKFFSLIPAQGVFSKRFLPKLITDFSLGAFLFFSILGNQYSYPATIGVSGDRFTINGQSTFLLGVSYFDAGYWRVSDLDGLAQRKFNLIRIWLDWSNPSFFDGQGLLQDSQKLLDIVRAANQRGMIVDVTIIDTNLSFFSPAEPAAERIARAENAMRDVARVLKNEPNVFYDMVNEHDNSTPLTDGTNIPFSHSELAQLFSAIRQEDPNATITVSSVTGHILSGSVTQDTNIDEELNIGVDVMTPHLDRDNFASETGVRVSALKGYLSSVGRDIPVYLQEENRVSGNATTPTTDDFLQAATEAKAAGAAGWNLHTDAGYDLANSSFFDSLTPGELDTVNALGDAIFGSGGPVCGDGSCNGNETTQSCPQDCPSGPDTTPPVISNIVSSGVTANSATINWSTDEVSDSQVEYGLTTAYGQSFPVPPNPALVTSHSVSLTGLTANTTYHYRVKSKDAAGNLATGQDFMLTTTTGGGSNRPNPPVLIYCPGGDCGSGGVCGNGNIDSGEQCDGSNLNGQTCNTLGFESGNLLCTAQCAFDTSQCVASSLPTVRIVSPSSNGTVSTSDVIVEFAATNWTVGGKGQNHIHFHLDGSSDHFMFFNAPNNVVEFNMIPGPTPLATWIAPNKIKFNGLSDGPHTVRAHLATPAHTPPGNPEADVTISFTVQTTTVNSKQRVESITWWPPSCAHNHMTVELPLDQSVSGNLSLNVRTTTHKHTDDCEIKKLEVEDENGVTLAEVPLSLICTDVTCTYNIPLNIDTTQFACDGQHVLNIRSVHLYNNVDKVDYLSTSQEIPIFVNNSKSQCTPQTPRRDETTYLVGRGFHQAAGNTCAEVANAPLDKVKGTHTFWVRACDVSGHLDVPVSRQLHPFPPTGPWPSEGTSTGAVVFGQNGNFQLPFPVTVDADAMNEGYGNLQWITAASISPLFLKEKYDSNLHHVEGHARVYFEIEKTLPSGPQLTITANPAFLMSPGSSSITWSSQNATSCIASGDWSGTKSPSGSETVTATKHSFYYLTCTGSGGSIAKHATVAVVRQPNTPTTSVTIGNDKLGSWTAGGNTLVWAEYLSGTQWQLKTQSKTLATIQTPVEFLNGSALDLEGNSLVYSSANPDADLFVYNLSTNTNQPIANQKNVHESGPAISGQEVAYAETAVGGGIPRIIKVNLSTSVKQAVSSAGAKPVSAPSIVQGYVVWADERNGNSDIYLYDPTTQQEYQLTSKASTQREPAIDVNQGQVYVVWADNRYGTCSSGVTECNNGSDIFSCEYNPQTHQCPERRMTHLTRSGRFDVYGRSRPVIVYPWVAWVDTRNGLANPDIYALNFITGQELAASVSREPETRVWLTGTQIYFDERVIKGSAKIQQFSLP